MENGDQGYTMASRVLHGLCAVDSGEVTLLANCEGSYGRHSAIVVFTTLYAVSQPFHAAMS